MIHPAADVLSESSTVSVEDRRPFAFVDIGKYVRVAVLCKSGPTWNVDQSEGMFYSNDMFQIEISSYTNYRFVVVVT